FNSSLFMAISPTEIFPLSLHDALPILSNFDGVAKFFPPKGYKILIPELPIYKMTLLRTNVKNFAKYVSQFIDHLGYKEVILLGKDRKSSRLNSSHVKISYAVFCLKKKI